MTNPDSVLSNPRSRSPRARVTAKATISPSYDPSSRHRREVLGDLSLRAASPTQCADLEMVFELGHPLDLPSSDADEQTWGLRLDEGGDYLVSAPAEDGIFYMLLRSQVQ